MPLRPPAGFIRPDYDPLKVPDAPTGVSASGGDASASVSFTPPTNVGGSAISAYYAVSNPGQITASGASSPVTVAGLTNDTAYTFTVWALNTYGPSPYSAASGSVTPMGIRALFGGGEPSNVIDYVTISTIGNATDFGDLPATASFVGACASSTRGVFATSSFSAGSAIQYVTIATAGNSSNFGDLNTSLSFFGGCNSSTRGVFGGGQSSSSVIQYITIASLGNAIYFGNLTATRRGLASCSSSTRGVFAGGYDQGATLYSNTIDYVTIATTGGATDFGDLNTVNNITQGMSGCSSGVRGVFAYSTSTETNSLTYITIATTGDSTTFGNLAVSTEENMATSSSTRGLFAGGLDGAANTNKIDYITIATTGNATDFGDLTVARRNGAGCSSGNGGLQ